MIRPITKLEAALIKSKMGVSTGVLLSLIWIIQVSSEQIVEIGIDDHQPATIEKINVDITHNSKNTVKLHLITYLNSGTSMNDV